MLATIYTATGITLIIVPRRRSEPDEHCVRTYTAARENIFVSTFNTLLSAGCWSAIAIVPIVFVMNCKEKNETTIMRSSDSSSFGIKCELSIAGHGKKECTRRNRIYIAEIITESNAYVELTYICARGVSFFATASANLFRNPFPKPISRNENQLTMELNVSQIPYRSVSR